MYSWAELVWNGDCRVCYSTKLHLDWLSLAELLSLQRSSTQGLLLSLVALLALAALLAAAAFLLLA